MGGGSSKKEHTKPVKKTKHYHALVDSVPSQAGKVIAITGCTSGTGLIAATTVAKLGAHVVMLNRPSSRATAALEKVRAASPSPDELVTHIDCDLQDFSSVRAASDTMNEKFGSTGLHVLANNAGIMATPDAATKDGYDTQMQTNHLSHFLLTARVFPLLAKAAEGEGGEARVVNHSSIARFGKPLEQKYFEANGGDLGGDSAALSGPGRWERYHQTKLANCIFTYGMHDKLTAAKSKVKVMVAHPGFALTELQMTTVKEGGMKSGMNNRMQRWFAQSEEDGTCGLLTCMVHPDSKSGDFYGPGKGKTAMGGKTVNIKKTKLVDDEAGKTMLWKASVAAVGEDFVGL